MILSKGMACTCLGIGDVVIPYLIFLACEYSSLSSFLSSHDMSSVVLSEVLQLYLHAG